MAAPDDTALKALIDSNIPDANPGLPRRATAAFVRATLKSLVDWVKTAINSNLSTWLRSSDNTPGGGNAESIYRTGLTTFKGGITSFVFSPNGPFSGVMVNQGALQLVGNGANGAAYMEFHVPGIVIQQLGVDVDGLLKFRNNGGAPKRVVMDGLTADFGLATTTGNRKLMLFDPYGNDHQFFGFGINSGTLRYQVLDGYSNHVFYAGQTPATSQELMRMQGNGRMGIGTPTPRGALDINGEVFTSNRYTLCSSNLATLPTFGIDNYNDLFRLIHSNDAAGNGGAVFVHVTNAGFMGVGLNMANATSQLHVKAINGHQQFRLETAYTPTGTADPNGAVGQIGWDTNYMYVKTTTGWKRTPLTTW